MQKINVVVRREVRNSIKSTPANRDTLNRNKQSRLFDHRRAFRPPLADLLS